MTYMTQTHKSKRKGPNLVIGLKVETFDQSEVCPTVVQFKREI